MVARMIIGKWIGASLGLMTGGFWGGLIGLFIGHIVDKSIDPVTRANFGAQQLKRQRAFFETTFSVMGHLAKADGRVSAPEIAQAEAIMVRSGLTDEHRQEAIRYFNQGVSADFELAATIERFVQQNGRNKGLAILLLEFLVSMALADGHLHPTQQHILTTTARYLGFTALQFQRLLAMLMAQRNFTQGGHSNYSYTTSQNSASELDKAYKALGVSHTVNDRDLKHAYRKLMGQHHPDKLASRGVPEEMLKMATQKAQEIQAAYALIKKERGKKI